MRKSTVIILIVIASALAALTLLMNEYVGHIEVEVRNAKDLSDALRTELAPQTRVKLRRVAGAPDLPIQDPARYGMLVQLEPSPASWAKDPSGLGIARDVAEKVLRLYDADRPVEWVRVRLAQARSEEKTVVFVRGEGGAPEFLR